MTDTPATGPEHSDVDAFRDLLDLMENFESNGERARYLLVVRMDARQASPSPSPTPSVTSPTRG